MRSASLTIATFSTADVALFMRPIPLRMMNQWAMYGFRIGRNASGLGIDPIDQVYSNITHIPLQDQLTFTLFQIHSI